MLALHHHPIIVVKASSLSSSSIIVIEDIFAIVIFDVIVSTSIDVFVAIVFDIVSNVILVAALPSLPLLSLMMTSTLLLVAVVHVVLFGGQSEIVFAAPWAHHC